MKAPRPGKELAIRTTDGCRASRQWPKLGFKNLAMDVNVKLLESPDGKNHLIIIVRGLIDAEGLEEIFRQVTEIIQHHFDCRILIDFEKANLRMNPKDIDKLVHRLGPDLRLGNIKIALVSPAETGDSEHVKVLSESLRREDLTTAVFQNAKEAVSWLISTM
jgi:hypothetical protein